MGRIILHWIQVVESQQHRKPFRRSILWMKMRKKQINDFSMQAGEIWGNAFEMSINKNVRKSPRTHDSLPWMY